MSRQARTRPWRRNESNPNVPRLTTGNGRHERPVAILNTDSPFQPGAISDLADFAAAASVFRCRAHSSKLIRLAIDWPSLTSSSKFSNWPVLRAVWCVSMSPTLPPR